MTTQTALTIAAVWGLCAATIVGIYTWDDRRDRRRRHKHHRSAACACRKWSHVDGEIMVGHTWHSHDRCQPDRERIR